MRLRILLRHPSTPRRLLFLQCVHMLVVAGGRFTCERRVAKPLRDAVYQEVQVPRYQCLRGTRTFRVDPEGTSRAQTAQRVKGLAVMLYLLGLSYGAVS